MKKEERNLNLYLNDIFESIQKIQSYLQDVELKEFKNSTLLQDAVVKNFENIGEAVHNLPKSFKEENSEIPWEDMYALRNRLAHEYFGIDYGIVWKIAKEYLPENLNSIKSLLDSQ